MHIYVPYTYGHTNRGVSLLQPHSFYMIHHVIKGKSILVVRVVKETIFSQENANASARQTDTCYNKLSCFFFLNRGTARASCVASININCGHCGDASMQLIQ